MSEYKSLRHEKFVLRYHIIFSTKYRKKCLTGIREQVLLSMKHAEQLQNKWKIEIMELDKDHIHFLIKATPTCVIANIIHSLKQTSTYEIWKNCHNHMSSYYWSGQHHLWTRGYFVSSIGDVSEKTLLEYIKNQG